MIEEEQENIERYCSLCERERLFVTTLSPKGDIVCCVCGHRESIIPFKMIQDDYGCRFVSGGNE